MKPSWPRTPSQHPVSPASFWRRCAQSLQPVNGPGLGGHTAHSGAGASQIGIAHGAGFAAPMNTSIPIRLFVSAISKPQTLTLTLGHKHLGITPRPLMPEFNPSSTQTADPKRGPNCWQCRFFGVSHIPATPYVCRAMGFQSRQLPSLEVLRVDGEFCRVFQPKTPTPSVRTAAKP